MRPLFLLLCLLGSSAWLPAQSGRFVATAPAEVAPDRQFAVTVTLENMRAAGELVLPDFAPLELVGGPQTSTSMQFINGRTSRSTSYTYYLRGAAEGTFVILPFGVETAEGWQETEPLRVVVRAGATPPEPQRAPRSLLPGFEELFAPPAAPEGRPAPRRRKRKTYRI